MADRVNERGAALIEAAIVTPLFLLILMGIFETSFMIHDNLKVEGAAGAGVRAATVEGATPTADYLTVQSVRSGLTTFDPANVEMVVVFLASGPGDTPPTGCLSVPVPAGLPCNSYTSSDFFLSNVDGGGNLTGHWGCGPTARDRNWCPTERQAALSDPGGPDHVGIHIRVRQPSLTGILGGDRQIDVTRIARIEPTAN
ncbi:MAG: TadE/TadG family type IV pilus assembly protein [Actinomycetota bacterium]